MARKPRDYKAEYARRIAREEARARAEGRQPSKHRARGHKSREHERAQRTAARIRRQTQGRPVAPGVAPPSALDDLIKRTQGDVESLALWRDIVTVSIEVSGLTWTVERLQTKHRHMALYNGPEDPGPGRGTFFGEYQTTKSYLPIELYFYHP